MARIQGISASLVLSPDSDEVPITSLTLKKALEALRTGKMRYVEFEGAMLLAVEDKWLQDHALENSLKTRAENT